MSTDTSAIRWQMADGLRERLLGPDGLPLADWLRTGVATVVKDGPHRAVYRLRLQGLDCHVKHNRLVGFRGRMRELLRPTKARREFALAVELTARGIPVPPPLAWGTEGAGVRPAASWLITETVADAVPLLTHLESVLPTVASASRRRLTEALGTFLGQLHAAGVVHHDLHPGNLLLRFDAADDPLLWLIDLHAVALGPPCPWPVRRANLAVFNRYFMLRASCSDRLRFWRAYRGAAGAAVPELDALAVRDLERASEQSNLRFWRARDGRCLHSNRYYTRVRSSTVRGHAVRGLDPAALAPLLADPDLPFGRSDVRTLKDSRSSTVVEFDMPVGGEVRRVVYKRFRVTDRREGLLALVRSTAAVRSWVFGHGLRERGLPSPRPLAVWHRVDRGDGYLLTEKVEGALDLHGFMARVAALPPAVATAELRRRAAALARLLRHLHLRGLTHRDLKASNVLTSGQLRDDRFWFIDLVGVRRRARVGRRRKVQNLARLNASFLAQPLVTRTVRLRFLLAYLQAGLHGPDGWKDRWRAIAAATEAKRAKNAKNGRPLA